MAAFTIDPQEAINFFRLSPDICCVISGDGRFLMVNDAAVSIMGYSRAGFQQITVFDLVHPEDRDLFGKNLDAVLSKRSKPFEGRFRRADGSYQNLLWNAESAGSRIYAVAQDITEINREKEARYRRLFETAKDAIILLDAQTNIILDVNQHTLELFAESRDALVGEPLSDARPFRANAIGDRVLSALDRSDVFRAEEALARGDGSFIDCELLCNAYFEGPRRVIQCNIRDISERRRHELALREGEERLRIIVEGVKDYAIFMMDREGKVESWNRAAESILGYSGGEIIGKQSSVLFVPEDRVKGEPRHEIETAIREGRAEDERWHLRKDGSRFFASGVLTPLWRPDGALRGFVKVMRDITDRKNTEEALRESQKLESVGLLAGGIAHDFNNLLTGIIGNASLAVEELPRSYQARRLVEEVIAAGARAAELTRQLLAYAGKGRFTIELFSISRVVSEIVNLIRASVPQEVRLELKLDENLPAIQADPSQIEQVAMNLVINAAESIEGHGTVRVSTGARRLGADELTATEGISHLTPGEYVFLEVTDTGSGIPPDIRARIFDPFFTTKFTGRGLGLAAVAGIVRAHCGGIQLETAHRRGSTFRVFFPAAADPAPRHDPAPAHEPVAGSGTILLVDDEDIVRRVSQQALERRGYHVLLAANGKEAVDVFQQRSREISLVVLDMAMPIMSGDEAGRQIREISPEVPILVTSGYSEAIASSRFGQGRMTSFIQKPYTSKQLAEKVADVLNQLKSAAPSPGEIPFPSAHD